jgi:hypothetical protein
MKNLSISLATATILATTSLSAGETKELKETEVKKPELSPWLSSMKINGQFKLWYQTMDHGGISTDKGLFRYDRDNANEWGNIEAAITVSGQVNDHLKHKMTLMTVSTLGLEGHVIAKETSRPGVFGASNGSSPQPFWVHEGYLDYVFTKNTDVRFGRMELQTPFAFTESWNASANSFEAIHAINKDITNTVLHGAWVAKGNGATDNLLYAPQVFGAESKYYNYMGYNYEYEENGKTKTKTISTGGALAVGAINTSLSDKNSSLSVPVQVWAYYVPKVAQAYWGQIDIKKGKVGGMDEVSAQLIGAQIGVKSDVQSYIKSNNVGDTQDTRGVALNIGTKMKQEKNSYGFNFAYSTIGKGNLPLANTATNYKKTKLPTASIFSDGMVAAQPDTTAWKLKATAKFDVKDMNPVSIMTSYAGYSVGKNQNSRGTNYANPNIKLGGPASMGVLAQTLGKDIDLNEFDFKVATKFKDLNVAAMYIYVSKTYVPGQDADKVYGEQSDSIFRIVSTLKF